MSDIGSDIAPTAPKGWTIPQPGISASGGKVASPLGQWSWAFFEGARNPHVLLITIYIFAPYFAQHLAPDATSGQSIWASLNKWAGVIIAVVAPFLGAIADAGGRRKPWLFFFSLTLAATAGALWYALPHDAGLSFNVICLLLVATFVSFDFTAVFHNAMLPTLVPDNRVARLSGLALALGNLSGVILFVFILIGFALPGEVAWPFISSEPWFGIDKAAHEPERMVGPLFVIWFIVFGLPLFFFTPDQPSTAVGPVAAVRLGLASLWRTVSSLRNYRNVGTYLVVRMIYNDGCNAVLIFGGIYAATTFHWTSLHMAIYGIILSIFATFGGVFGGWIDDRFGSRNGLLIAVGGTIVGFGLALTMRPDRILYFFPFDVNSPHVHSLPFFNTWPELIYVAIVIIIAIFITASYANSRTMLARIAPTTKMTEFFGLYALSGTATAFLAPWAVELTTEWSGDNAIGLSSILVLLAIGWVGMLWVKNERAQAAE
jgi:UMF1 family MFS transporter